MVNLLKFVFKLLGIGVLVLFVIAILFMVRFFVVMIYAESSARSLAPTEYPNAELIEKWHSGGSDSMWDRRMYHTSDSVDQVFLFMEDQMPNFTTKSDPEKGAVYSNYASNTNWLAQQAAEIACTSLYCIEESALTYPSASVTFYSDPDNPTSTLIEVWLSWPAQ